MNLLIKYIRSTERKQENFTEGQKQKSIQMERCNMGWEGNINVIKMLIFFKFSSMHPQPTFQKDCYIPNLKI